MNKRPQYMIPTKTRLLCKDTHSLKLKGWNIVVLAYGDQKEAEVVMLISEKNAI